jgi:hypothetical protein
MTDKDIIAKSIATNKFISIKIDTDYKASVQDAAIADFNKQVKSAISKKKTIHLLIVSP